MGSLVTPVLGVFFSVTPGRSGFFRYTRSYQDVITKPTSTRCNQKTHPSRVNHYCSSLSSVAVLHCAELLLYTVQCIFVYSFRCKTRTSRSLPDVFFLPCQSVFLGYIWSKWVFGPGGFFGYNHRV